MLLTCQYLPTVAAPSSGISRQEKTQILQSKAKATIAVVLVRNFAQKRSSI
jgi:hypothetical protein